MTKTKKRLLVGSLLIVVALLLVGGVSRYAFASRMMGQGRWGEMPWSENRGDRAFRMELIRALNPMDFSAEQWKKFDEIAENLRTQGRSLRRNMGMAFWRQHADLRKMMLEEGFDEEKAGAMIAKVRPDFVRMVEEVVRSRNELYGMLNDAQRAKVDAVLAVVEKRIEEHVRPSGRGPMTGMMRRLKLTSDQRTQMEAVFSGAAPKMQEYAKSLFEQIRAEHAVLAEGPMTGEQVSASAEKIADMAAGALMEMGRARAEAWKILTPEQREEMKGMHASMGGMHRRPGRMRK